MIQRVIEEAFELGDEEEQLAHGFIEGDDDSVYQRSETATAEYVLRHWSCFDISHYLVGRSIRSFQTTLRAP